MNVRQLVEILSKLDQTLDVIVVHDHPTKGPIPFDIDTVGPVNVIKSRDAVHRPQIAVDNENGRPVVSIDVTDDF